MENKIKHLEMIQAIITRMNSNSFMLKGWAVTLVAGVFALASKEANEFYFLIAFIPVILFGGWMHIIFCRNDSIEIYITMLEN